jgi:hypothetical protein
MSHGYLSFPPTPVFLRQDSPRQLATRVTNLTDGHVPDTVYEEARRVFDEKEVDQTSQSAVFGAERTHAWATVQKDGKRSAMAPARSADCTTDWSR